MFDLNVLAFAFQELWGGVSVFALKFIVALIVFIVGWIIAAALGKVVAQLVGALKVDKALQGLGAEEVVARAGMRLDSGAFLGGLVKWFVILVFLLAVLDVFELQGVTEFLRNVVLTYIPQVIVAAFILLAAALLADLAYRVVSGSARAAGFPSAAFLGGVVKWAIWVFAILAALFQLGIAGAFVQTLFVGFVAMISLAGGLAFGLGGKDTAAKFLERLRQDISE